MGSSFEDSLDAIPEGCGRAIPHKEASVMLLTLGREMSWPLFSGNKASSSSLNIPHSFHTNTSTKKKEMANIS